MALKLGVSAKDIPIFYRQGLDNGLRRGPHVAKKLSCMRERFFASNVNASNTIKFKCI